SGAHVRFWGEAGLHDIRDPETRDGVNPAVLALVSTDTLLAYRPPEGATRRGFLREREIRREYDIGKGEMHDEVLDRGWTGMRAPLMYWLEPAVHANTRQRLLRLIVE